LKDKPIEITDKEAKVADKEAKVADNSAQVSTGPFKFFSRVMFISIEHGFLNIKRYDIPIES